MIKILESEYNKILNHGEATYPNECCGVLIGKSETITEVRKMTNTNAGNPKRRYNIDPIELLHLEDELEENGLDMIGIYHSHPDHPARPSTYDLEHAWPNLSYMVLRVARGKSEKLTSWRLEDNREKFIEEEIIMEEK